MSAEEAFDDLDLLMSGEDPDWDVEPVAAVDMEQADRWLNRLARLDRQDEQTRMLAGMRRQTVDEWEAEQLARTATQREWLEASLRGFHLAVLSIDKRSKTITLPAGVLKARAQQPEWVFDEEKFVRWARQHRPELIRVPSPPRPAPDRTEARKAFAVKDGRAVDPTTGEVVDGITVNERADKLTQEPTR